LGAGNGEMLKIFIESFKKFEKFNNSCKIFIYEKSPELPYGYPSSIILSLMPPLWFRKMNPLVPKKMKISRV